MLRQKSALIKTTVRRARGLQLALQPHQTPPHPRNGIPIFGSIPAGFTQDCCQDAKGSVSLDLETLGIRNSPYTFALEVRGDSLIGRHICDGDLAVMDHEWEPHSGDVVAALIDHETTLKTFIQKRGQPAYLRAEIPRFPELFPVMELIIQGVMVALVRKQLM